MFPTVVGRLPFRLQANFAMTRERTASDLLGPIHPYLANTLIEKNDSSMQKLGERFEAFRLVTRIFGISSSTLHHSLYVHNNLNARETDVRKVRALQTLTLRYPHV